MEKPGIEPATPNLQDVAACCLCNTFLTSNSFARSDTDVVIDSEPHLSRTCKTSLLFAPLAVRVHTGSSALPFYTKNR